MADYGIIEWYKNQLQEYTKQKEIYLYAMENVARRDFQNYELIDNIANRIASVNNNITFYESQLKNLEGNNEN